MGLMFRKRKKYGPMILNFTENGFSSWSIKIGRWSWNSAPRRTASTCRVRCPGSRTSPGRALSGAPVFRGAPRSTGPPLDVRVACRHPWPTVPYHGWFSGGSGLPPGGAAAENRRMAGDAATTRGRGGPWRPAYCCWSSTPGSVGARSTACGWPCASGGHPASSWSPSGHPPRCAGSSPRAPRARVDRALVRLVVALVAGLLAFALADYVVAGSRPGQFVRPAHPVDALYFALTTLTTIGYGDVHAQGQIARVVVSCRWCSASG